MTVEKDKLSLQLAKTVQVLQNSEPMQAYMRSRQQMNQSVEANALIQKFQQAKKIFTEVERYGKWAPDYEEKRLSLSNAKKEMNENHQVQNFQAAESRLACLLDDLTERIFSDVVDKIPIEFQSRFRSTHKGHQCACHSGKSGCNCKE